MKVRLTILSALSILFSTFSIAQEAEGSEFEVILGQETGVFIEDEAAVMNSIDSENAETKEDKLSFRDVFKDLKRDLKESRKAQKKISKDSDSKGGSGMSEVAMILLIILAIILPWLAVGLYTDWDLTFTLIALLLWFLFILPGIIFAFLVIFDVIG